MLTSGRNGTIYTGVTSDIVRRVYQHRAKVVQGFMARYDVKHLVWFEVHQSIVDAIQREKNLKHWSRAWKIALIEKTNPTWRDLYGDLAG
jgi:putative endonuclease